MKILIPGICGFVGSTLARGMVESWPGVEIWGLDNLSRSGSETNRRELQRLGIRVIHGDVRLPSDLETLPAMDWVIDASANPSVMGGVRGQTSSRQIVEHNLLTTVNLLEFCKQHRAGFILLSTSRVYSIPPLAALKVRSANNAFLPVPDQLFPKGVSESGINEDFSTAAPVSLYGATKLASEALALEYGGAFGLPVWINRCGVMAGAGQFGRADQGLIAFWLNAWASGAPLCYIGFGGKGWQVRDVFHPLDLLPLLRQQMRQPDKNAPRIFNLGGGLANAVSLAQLSDWCRGRFGRRVVKSDPEERPYDLPWVVMDSSLAQSVWKWKPRTSLQSILEEVANHAEKHPDWLAMSSDQPMKSPGKRRR